MIGFFCRNVLFFIVGIFIASSNASATEIADSMRPIEGEAIVGYLNTMPSLQSTGAQFVIEEDTIADSSVDRTPIEIKQQMMEASGDVIADFLRINQKPALLKLPSQLLRADIHIKIVDSGHLRKIFGDRVSHPWDKFHREFSKTSSLLSFSRVGIDERTGQALVLFSFSCGMLCGKGFLVLLQRDLNGWHVLQEVMVWIS